MNKLLCSAFAATLILSAYSASAATTTTNSKDASTVSTSATTQTAQPNNAVDTIMPNKNVSKKSHMNKRDMESSNMKMMDTNGDNLVSKDEYMAYHNRQFSNMKQTKGMVNIKDMQTGTSNKSSINKKPIGTTTGTSSNGSVDITKYGNVNGTHKGTN